MAMRGFFVDNGPFEKFYKRIGARRIAIILKKASDSTMYPEDPEKGDKLFKPKTEAEAEYWKILRDDIKNAAVKYLEGRKNGSTGGRPKKQPVPETKQAQPEPQKTNLDRAEQIRNLCNNLGRKMTDKKPFKKVLITEDFNLAKLDGPIGEAFRMKYPPERTNALHRVSQWLRQPEKFLGEEVDTEWLDKQIKKYFQ